jgi:outer membrane protein assembly factor BamB
MTAPLHASDAVTLRHDTGWSTGLVVVCGDPATALDLGRDGRQLVVWFSDDAREVRAVREEILGHGLQGVVTADPCEPGKIPLRGEIANVVAVDPSVAGEATPTDAEIRRVLIPGGSQYRKEGAVWRHQKKPWPKGYGDWTHLDHGPDGNAVANDRVAEAPRGIQWLGGIGDRGGDPLVLRDSLVLGYEPVVKDFRLDKTVKKPTPAIAERMAAPRPMRRSVDRWRACRDAFNGLPRWKHLWDGKGLTPLVLIDGRALMAAPLQSCYGVAQKDDIHVPLRAIDLRTGEVITTFDKAPQLLIPLDRRGLPRHGSIDIQAVAQNGVVYIAGLGNISACDIDTGDVLWRVNSEGKLISHPVISPDGARLYCLDADAVPAIVRYFGQRKVRHLVCIDPSDGTALWRQPVTSNEASSLIAIDDGVLVGRLSMHGWNVAAGKPRDPKDFIYGVDRFDARGGKLWTTYDVPPEQRRKLGHIQIGCGASNMIVHGEHVYVAEHYRTVRINLQTGEADSINTSNIGCQRMFGMSGQIGYANLVLWSWSDDGNFEWTYHGFAHPACGGGFTVANGRFYLRSIAMCDCNFHLRTTMGLHSEPPCEPVADGQRLTPGDRLVGPVGAAPTQPPTAFTGAMLPLEWEIGYYGRLNNHYTPVPVRQDDTLQGTPPRQGGLTFVPMVHTQRLEARGGGQVAWAQQLGGRPAGLPVLAGGNVIQACRDGYVYAFDPATGKPKWRFLAARADQRLVNSGQVESVWPCVGAVVFRDVVAIASGISPEMDGGGMVWGLNPATGAVEWRVALETPPITGSGLDRRSARYAGHHTYGWGFPIQAIKVVEGHLAIGYRRTANFGSHGSTFWAWVGIDPAREKTVDLAARWKGTDRVWREFDDGAVSPKDEEGNVQKREHPAAAQ